MEFDADLAATAREIKRLFIEQKRIRMRNPNYKPDQRNNAVEVWMKAAETCVDLGANPENFVTAAFAYCSLPAGPFGTGMSGPSVRRWYQSHIDSQGGMEIEARTPSEFEIKNRMASLNSMLMAKLGTIDPDKPEVIQELASPLYGLDPLACIMLAGDKAEVVRRHKTEALDILARRPDLARSMQEMGFPLNVILKDD